METELRRNFKINGQTAYATMLKANQAKIFLLSELPESTVRTMGLKPVTSLQEALTEAYKLLGDNPSTYVIPFGSAVVPWIADS